MAQVREPGSPSPRSLSLALSLSLARGETSEKDTRGGGREEEQKEGREREGEREGERQETRVSAFAVTLASKALVWSIARWCGVQAERSKQVEGDRPGSSREMTDHRVVFKVSTWCLRASSCRCAQMRRHRAARAQAAHTRARASGKLQSQAAQRL